MRKLITLLLFLACLSTQAATRISLTVTITNIPVTGNSNTINGSLRQWTNSSSSSTILTNLVGIGPSATNFFNNYASFTLGSGITHRMTESNVIVFTAPLGASLSGSAVGGWASSVLSTQSGPSTFTALWPLENMVGETNRTNQGSSLLYGIGIYSTNAFPTNSTAVSNLRTKGATAGPQHIISELRISGNINNGTGNLGVSNLVNSGNAIRSGGVGGNSLAVGSNAQALASVSMAVGNGAVAGSQNAMAVGNASVATNINTTAVGYSAQATAQYATALGTGATASEEAGIAVGEGVVTAGPRAVGIGDSDTQANGYGDVAVGRAAVATGGKSIALGDGSSTAYTNSASIGAGAAATTTNQIRLGTSTETVSVPGMLETGTATNLTATGTNTINAILVVRPINNTGLANGYNAGIAVNQAMVRYSGPTAAYTNVGFSAANKMDGKMVFAQFDNPGLSVTFLHNSGLDPGNGTNRIHTGTGALVNSTNNPVMVIMSYDNDALYWRLWSIR